MQPESLQEVSRRIEVIIALLIRTRHPERVSVPLREQVWTLHELGLKPSQIAQILGRSSSYVNKELSGLRRQRD